MVKDNIMRLGNVSKTWGIICVLALVLFALPISFAEGVQIHRDYPSSAKMGSIIQINITVDNPGDFGTMATIQDNVGDYTVITPSPVIPNGTPGMIGLRLPYFEWNITLNPRQNKNVYYKVNLTSPGEIMLSPAVVIAGNETVSTTPGSINVICNQNDVCETNLSENYFTCPEDCPSGSNDGICDLMRDGRCDPDCAEGFDIDCSRTDPIENETNFTDENPPETEPSLLETYWWVIPIAVVLIILVVIYIFLKKRSKPKQESEWQADYQNAPAANP